MDLRNLIETHLDLPRLSRDLDEIGPAARRWAVMQWSASDLARLWEATDGYRAVSPADLLPPGSDPGDSIVFEGASSWTAMRHFQKCFCKSTDGDKLVGYVRQPWSGVTGPGFFVVRPAGDAVEIDYTAESIPLRHAPAGWPHPVSNAAGLRAIAFGGVVDLVRGLSDGVVVGRMKRRGVFRDLWFAMVRGEVQKAAVATEAASAASPP